jgi:hypothetical protein
MENILDLQNQSSLAKLLATENITVTHSASLSTAYFDVKNRVLGLPVWKNQGKVVYDMLVGHEVSHALYTPHKQFSEFLAFEGRSHFDILNIIEDIRIERLIKLKYAGMPRIFNGAYKSLVEADFFSIKGKDINKFNFLDRLNLHAKVGNHVDIPLSAEELDLYNKCFKAETFEEVIALYHEIKAFTKEEAEKKQEQSKEDEEEQSEGEGQDESGESSEGEESSEDQESDDTDESFSNSADDGEESESSEPEDSDESSDDDSSDESIKSDDTEDTDESNDRAAAETESGGDAATSEEEVVETHKSETMESFKENVNDADSKLGGAIAMMPSKKSIEDHIIPFSKVMAERPTIESTIAATYDLQEDRDKELERINSELLPLKKKINKKVSVLAREFERRKASYQYSRAQESRRGSLDVNNLHKYKYDDQIFQTTMRLADAKSHGMIFFVDYSGSMSSVLKDVLEHTLNLVQFCKKVGIPFEVYGFTSDYRNECNIKEEQSDYEFDLNGTMVFELFSSKMSKTVYQKAFTEVCHQILMQGAAFSSYACSPYEWLGGTPLDATLLCAQHIVNKFNKQHAVQKTNVIILSDGDSHRCEPRNRTYGQHRYLVNIGGKQYKLSSYGMTAQLTELLSKITHANVIGFYLPSSTNESRLQLSKMTNSYYRDSKVTTAVRQYKKDGYAVAHKHNGYDSYFLLPLDVEIKDADFAFGDDSTCVTDSRAAQSKLAREYAKHNVKNRQSRIILTKFAELIA